METIVYKDYENAYDTNHSMLDDVKFHVNMVSEDYDPRQNHKWNDVKDYVICSTVGLNGNIILKKTMSEIVDKIKEKLLLWIPEHYEQISKDVDKVFNLKPEKADRIKERIFNVDFINGERDYWDYLVKHGIKWFVIRDETNNFLCFCKSID